MSNLILYTIDGPLFKCIDCERFVVSEEHDCKLNTYICSIERFEEIKAEEMAKQNG